MNTPPTSPVFAFALGSRKGSITPDPVALGERCACGTVGTLIAGRCAYCRAGLPPYGLLGAVEGRATLVGTQATDPLTITAILAGCAHTEAERAAWPRRGSYFDHAAQFPALGEVA